MSMSKHNSLNHEIYQINFYWDEVNLIGKVIGGIVYNYRQENVHVVSEKGVELFLENKIEEAVQGLIDDNYGVYEPTHMIRHLRAEVVSEIKNLTRPDHKGE